MPKPHIICHMLMSLDGKVTGDFLFAPRCEKATEEYYRINREWNAQAYACGRVTMEGSFTGGWYPDLAQYAPAEDTQADFVAKTGCEKYAVAFDRQGRLGWKTADIEDEDPGYGGAHIIEVLTADVDPRYLAYLRATGVSYIFANNPTEGLEKLEKYFSIKTLLLEGGSIINGAFQREGLVDELSLVVVPVVAGADSKPLFYESQMEGFQLTSAEQLADGAVWMRYGRL